MVYFPKFNTILGTLVSGEKKGELLFSGSLCSKDAAGDVGVLGLPRDVCVILFPVWQAGEHRVTEAHGWVSRDPNVMETNCSGYQTQWGGKLLHAPVFLPVPLPTDGAPSPLPDFSLIDFFMSW